MTAPSPSESASSALAVSPADIRKKAGEYEAAGEPETAAIMREVAAAIEAEAERP